MLDDLSTRLRSRRHSALLVSIVAAFAMRPVIGDTRVALVAFSVTVVVVLLLALYTIQVDDLTGDHAALLAEHRRRTRFAWLLAVPALIERLVVIVTPNAHIYLVGSVLWLLLMGFAAWSLLRSMLRARTITGETISLAIATYLLIGFTWGLLYIALLQVQPHAFSFEQFADGPASVGPHQQTAFPILIYFSLSTLSTVGFGDVTPVTLQARYAAVAEGITGQFYLAILVARLVSMQLSTPDPRDR